MNITLIKVPYWWDLKVNSLKATIYSYRPELFTIPPTAPAIPQEMPTLLRGSRTKMLLAGDWDTSMDPTGW